VRAEERAIIERCRQHDLEAFDELVRLYERRIFNFALRLSGNHHDAEDITVETFIRVFNAIANFRGDATFSTWLFRIAHNVFLDMRKKERAHPHTSLQDVLELDESEVTRQVEDPGPLPEQLAEDAELSQLLRRAINELPDYQKTMVCFITRRTSPTKRSPRSCTCPSAQ